MDQLRLALVVAEAGLHATRLEGLEVGARGDFPVGVLGRQPDLQVVGLGAGEADVASEIKQGEWQTNLSWSLSSSTISSRTKLVTGYSAVGMRYRSRPSILKRSPLNFARLETPSAHSALTMY